MTASALEILEDGRKRLQTAKRQIERELADETGRFTTNDLRKLLVKEAELEAGYLETRALSDYAWEGLRLAAGAPEDARLELAEKALPEVEIVEREVDGWMNLAGAHRADVRLVDAGFRARQGQVDLATAEFFPDIALVAAFGYAKGTSATDNPDPFANDQYNFLSWGVVVGAEWKLDFAARIGKLREAEANLSKLRGQRDALRQKMRLEIVEELGMVRRYTAELEARRQAMKAGKGWLVSNTMNFGIGLATTDELLDSLVAYSTARLGYFRTLFELNIAVARLQNAVGVAVVVPAPKSNP
jgi:outer membrane protein TolC